MQVVGADPTEALLSRGGEPRSHRLWARTFRR